MEKNFKNISICTDGITYKKEIDLVEELSDENPNYLANVGFIKKLNPFGREEVSELVYDILSLVYSLDNAISVENESICNSNIDYIYNKYFNTGNIKLKRME